jgi:membrane-associated phospholipid phosphatase
MRGKSSADSAPPLLRRFTALWRLKLGALAAVNLLFWSCYLFLSRHSLLPVHTLPMTWLDHWIGFRPSPWAWVYESIFLLTGIIPWLITSEEALFRYLKGFALLSAVSFAFFALFPVASPRPTGLESSRFLVFVTHIDGPLNAFPSLHAGCLVYTLALAGRLFPRRSMVVATGLLIWGVLILIGTLATKQHYAVDLLAGAMLGGTADWIAWRTHSPGESASMKIRRKSEAASHGGCR